MHYIGATKEQNSAKGDFLIKTQLRWYQYLTDSFIMNISKYINPKRRTNREIYQLRAYHIYCIQMSFTRLST